MKIRTIKFSLLILVSVFLWIEAFNWFTCIGKGDVFRNGTVPFQAIIFNQKDGFYQSNFTSIYDGKHLITFSYQLDETNSFKNTIDFRNSHQASMYPAWPDFAWSIKKGSKLVAEGASSVAQASGTRELFLGVVELQQNAYYSIEIKFKPSFLDLQKMLPQLTVQVESASPLFMAGIYGKYAITASIIFAILGVLMFVWTIRFWKKNYGIRSDA